MTEASNRERRERLSAARRELLQRRLRGSDGGADARPAPAIEARPAGTDAPASFAQARLYFLQELFRDSTAYNMQTALRLHGDLDREALTAAVAALRARHASLRTTFRMRDGELQQVTGPPAAADVELVDVGDRPPERREHAMRSAALRAVNQPFNLSLGPLLRATLIRLDRTEHVLVLTVHHIVADEWSLGLMLRELAVLYGAGGGAAPGLTEPAIDYGDYAAWQRQRVARIRDEQLAYWRGQLAGADFGLELPADHRRPARQSFRGALVRHDLDPSLADGVRALGRRANATPFMTLLAAFFALLHRYTGQDDIVVGTPAANRTPVETEALVGLFLNSVVMRARLDGGAGFLTLLEHVRDTAIAGYANQELPLETLVAELQPERDLSRNPLFQAMFVLETEALPGGEFADLRCERVELDAGHAKLDLTLFVGVTGDRLSAAAEYSTDLFERESIERMLHAYETLLAAAVADPAAPVDTLALVPAQAEQEALQAARGPELAAADRGATVLDDYRGHAQREPDAPALVAGGERLSRGELDRRARRVAQRLREGGAGAGRKVAVLLERGADQLAAVIGVLLAGAAYVPLDPSWPAGRRRQVLDDLARVGDAPLAVTREALRATLDLDDAGIVCIEALARDPGAGGDDAAGPVGPADDAYVIYTSGSTGRPKGVAVTHANLAASTAARFAYYGEEVERFLLVSSLAFDSSVAGLFWTLASGGTLVLPADEAAADARLLAGLIERERITHTLMLPSLYELLLEASTPAQLASLRTVMVAGEACSTALARRHAALLPGVRLTNEYGPTEATVWATAYDCTGDERDTVPIGTPIPGAAAYVLDRLRRPVPLGVAGELCVGGAGVTAGYLGRPELTAERFVADPFAAGGDGRLYLTGDRVRRNGSGQLEFLGRLDDQIKLRGFRVEVGEIEALLRAHERVADAAVTVVGDADGRPQQLVAWFTAAGDEPPAAGELRRHLAAQLPDYMLPSRFDALPELPRMPNGKLDRARLPAPGRPARPAEAVEYADATAAELAAIWRQLLGVDAVQPDDDFFALGGHSLSGVSLMMEIERRLKVALPLTALFEAPRLAQLAARIRERRTAVREHLLIPIQPDGSRLPLICVHGGARQLTRHLGPDQPVYLAFSHLGDSDPEDHTVEDMAARYLHEVRGVQPSGPYRIVGFSFGGQIAYEMARQLRAAGETVDVLALCDPPPPEALSYYQQQWQLRMADIRRGSGPLGRAKQTAAMLGRVALGRLRTLRLKLLAAYFSRTRRSGRILWGAAAALVLAGFGTWLGAGMALNQPQWKPLSLALTPGAQQTQRFTAPESGTLEIELEVDHTLPLPLRRRTVLALKEAAPLDVSWAVEGPAGTVARGDVADYSYLDNGPQSLLGRLRRILLRVPFGQNELYFASFGLLGHATAARGVGKFEATAGQTYALAVTSGDNLETVAAGDPRLVVRLSRWRFAERYRAVMPLAIGGMAVLALGLLLGLVAFLRQRQAPPAELVRHRQRQHYRRLSSRYRYPAYDGPATLLLPEPYRINRDQTEAAWRRRVSGPLALHIIPGARGHLDMINEKGGAGLAAHLARLLDAADQSFKGQS